MLRTAILIVIITGLITSSLKAIEPMNSQRPSDVGKYYWGFLAGFGISTISNEDKSFERFGGIDLFTGMQLKVPLFSNERKEQSIRIRAIYGIFFDSRESEGVYNEQISKENKLRVDKSFSLTHVDLEVTYSYDLLPHMASIAGIKASRFFNNYYRYQVESTWDSLVINKDIPNVKYLDPYTATIYDGEISDLNSYFISIPIGFEAKGVTKTGWLISMAGTCDFSVNKLFKEKSWSFNSFYLDFGLSFPL